ncbi:MAG TPA: MMPL family transporter [Caulobacteraceae bacterium]
MKPRAVFVARLVAFSCGRARLVAGLGLALGILALAYAVSNFSMNTDVDKLISKSLPFQQRQAAFSRLFQPEGDQIVSVIDAATPELADTAAEALTSRLRSRPDLFHDVVQPDGGAFFDREGLLYESVGEVQSSLAQLIAAQPFLGPMAADPSLRGLMNGLSTALQGVSTGQANLADLRAPLTALAHCLGGLRDGRAVYFSWRNLVSGKSADRRELRHIVLASPVLNFARLEPGADGTRFIRAAAQALRLDPAHGVTVRLTGTIPLQDEEFATLAQRAALIASLAISAILIMLWLAVKSVRLMAAILLVTLIGLVTTAACGLAIFHRFNVISVAFIPLFVGLGIDFGIQLTVRYRAEHTAAVDTRQALVASGAGMGRSLALAAVAIASGFFAFAPTAYVGVSQLGVIAGIGMFIALALNLTVLPAFIALASPAPRPSRPDNPFLTRLDGFILGNRRGVLIVAAVAAAISAALLPLVQFDFNPIHLRSAKTQSVSTLLDLMRDPDQSPNTLEVIAPSLGVADQIAQRMRRLPSVAEAITLSSFVPADQPQKLAAIADAAALLDLTLDPLVVSPGPSDGEVVASLRQTAADLRAAAGQGGPAAGRAIRLAGQLDWLAGAPAASRAAAQELLIPGLTRLLSQTRTALQPSPLDLATLPVEIRRDWLASGGRARVSIVPGGNSNDNRVLSRFIAAVSAQAPLATGTPVDIQQSGRAVAGAFIEAGALSFLAITALLFAVLRRIRDVAITMAPIILTGLLTMGSCVIIGQPLNFANIIALPLLFGIGVAFHIYFVMAWRSGAGHLLQSSLTRAIFFSALATATGFGSLWASSHPGTASMGKLLMISLIWTLVSALLFQPALMGPPTVAAGPKA